MKVISDLKVMAAETKALAAAGKTAGFVPTMGALHEGHLSLVRKCRGENDATIVSIFVNPKQFAPHEDYRRYPRTPGKDLEALERAGADLVFTPEAESLFPPGFQTRVEVEKLSQLLYGKVRPHFFGGVAVAVLKLLNLVKPDRAYFGEKDYQQLLLVRRMAEDLNLGIEIIPCPIVREKDGLAMSSRNAYLSPEERRNAAKLYQALKAGEEAVRQGEKNPDNVTGLMKKILREIPNVVIDYTAAVHPQTLDPLREIESEVYLGVCAKIGQTRLLDGITVKTSIFR